ncbi:type II toxin-antitoxin system RelE/ParE family toxin [Massilia sp. TWR1-2-2]|uniref:type II toxin-antitoxin system RelE/ParE family toxin n=1 Tax=Massilia sp. TWR1-2-2 TaxID=2804584 RepID=UPI003CE9548C
MPNFIVRPKARIDLDGIWDFIAADSQAQADAFVDRVIKKFKLLARQPGLGRIRDELMPELQSFPFERYVIFYRGFKRDRNHTSAAQCSRRGRPVPSRFVSSPEGCTHYPQSSVNEARRAAMSTKVCFVARGHQISNSGFPQKAVQSPLSELPGSVPIEDTRSSIASVQCYGRVRLSALDPGIADPGIIA